MFKPTERQAAICRFVIRQFPHHLTLRTRVRQHVDEIQHHDVQRGLHAFQLRNDALAEITLVDLPVIETLASAIAVQQRLNQLFLVLVLALFVAFFYPVLREHLLNLQRHQAGENSIPGILGSRRQNGRILFLFLHRIELTDQRLDRFPLVVAEVIDHA